MAFATERPEREWVNLGPPLSHEMPKPPFRPGVIGRIAFFFSIVAGALVCIINLRRMGYPQKAAKVLWATVAGSVAFASLLLLLPDAIGRLAALLCEGAFYFVFPNVQDSEFNRWQTLHPEISPASGWKAIGWGFLGMAMFFVIAIVVAVALQAMGLAS